MIGASRPLNRSEVLLQKKWRELDAAKKRLRDFAASLVEWKKRESDKRA